MSLIAPMSPEEAAAIKSGETLYVEKITVHGTYKSGVQFVREYPAGIHLNQLDRIFLNYGIEYPDPMAEDLDPRTH